MLTLVEYLLLLYRALLPTPVWYRFFLNKEYGSFFSSLMTGLYLTFKLTSVIEKVFSPLKCVVDSYFFVLVKSKLLDSLSLLDYLPVFKADF